MKLNELKTILMSTSNYRIYKNGIQESYINYYQYNEEEILKEYGECNVIFVRPDIINMYDDYSEPILEIYLED